jgi:hypothetical protein
MSGRGFSEYLEIIPLPTTTTTTTTTAAATTIVIIIIKDQGLLFHTMHPEQTKVVELLVVVYLSKNKKTWLGK